MRIMSPLLSQMTQEDFFRSMNQNMETTGGGGKLLALVFAVAALILLLAVINHRRKGQVAPRSVNHHGKLLKEVARSAGLKPGELKRLKQLAEKQNLSSPLTLLLCPSLLSKAMDDSRK